MGVCLADFEVTKDKEGNSDRKVYEFKQEVGQLDDAVTDLSVAVHVPLTLSCVLLAEK